MSDLPIIVTAYVLPGKPDNAAEAHFANSDHAEGFARTLLASGYYCSVQIDCNGESHILLRDPEPETPAPSGKSYTVEVKQGDRPYGWYVEVTDNQTGQPTPGVRNIAVRESAIRRAQGIAERLRKTGAEVTLLIPEGASL